MCCNMQRTVLSSRYRGTKFNVSWEQVFRGLRLQVRGLKARSSVPLSALNKWLSHERSQPFWLAHEHEKLTPCQLKDQEVLTFWLWWTSGQWSCFLFCVKQYVPSVHWCCESFLEERRLLRKTTETPLLTTTQVQLWPKMAQELNAHGGWKEWGSYNNTHKKNRMDTSNPTSTLDRKSVV